MNQLPIQQVKGPAATWRHVSKLFTNHMDAWGVALIIAVLALIVHDALNWRNATILLAIACAYWLGFAYNDYRDAPHDALDEAKGRNNFFVACQIPRKWVILSLFALSFGLILGAFILFELRGLLVAALSLPVIWAYSGRPIRLKSRPGLDLLTHTFFVETYPYAVTLLLLGAAWNRLDVALVVIFFFGSLSAQLEQQVADYEIDARTEPNFTTRLGPKRTMLLLRLTTILLAAAGFWFFFEGTIPIYMVPFGLITAPMLAHRFLRQPGQQRLKLITRGSMVAGLLYAGVVVASYDLW
jgi:4-hydroxybenzoate polyprenyltransferase